MRMKAIDSFHTSQTKTVQQGQEFEVHDQLAKDLQAVGLAEPVGGGEGEKAEEPPENKAEEPPENKAEPAPVSKATVRKRVTRTEEE